MTVVSSNPIILTPEPKGHFIKEATIGAGLVGTVYPGTQMKLQSDGTWLPFTASADGAYGEVALLVEDQLQGQPSSVGYVASQRCFIYVPGVGDECNVLFQAYGTGSGSTLAIGSLLMVGKGTGQYIPTTGSPAQTPWITTGTVAESGSVAALVPARRI